MDIGVPNASFAAGGVELNVYKRVSKPDDTVAGSTVNTTEPKPQRRAESNNTGEAGMLLIVATTGTRALSHPLLKLEPVMADTR